MNVTNRIKGWLLPTALVLFLLEMILLPFAAQQTYAGRSENPDHLLTYTAHQLTWDSGTGVDPDTGVAELSLFGSTYRNVEGQNGEKVVAPGTQASNIVRLKNETAHSITYIAVMYRIKEQDSLPVAPALADDDAFADTQTYPLPQGVAEQQVVRAVTGSVEAGQIQDFDITWLWAYYESDERDVVDTALGNKAAWGIPDDVTAGLYIVVEEAAAPDPTPTPGTDPGTGADPGTDATGGSDNQDASQVSYIYPRLPQTGDPGHIMLYLILMAVSGILLVLLVLERRKGKQ